MVLILELSMETGLAGVTLQILFSMSYNVVPVAELVKRVGPRRGSAIPRCYLTWARVSPICDSRSDRKLSWHCFPQLRHILSTSEFGKIQGHVVATYRLDHVVDVGWIYEGLDSVRPGTAVLMPPVNVERIHWYLQEICQPPVRTSQLMSP